MANKRNKTNYTGVYSREHETCRSRGKPDLCYDICYRLPGDRKLIWEKVGWLSEKITAAAASSLRSERIKQSRVGNLPTEVAKLSLNEVFEKFRIDYLEVARKYPKDAIRMYTKWIGPVVGEKKLAEITPAMVDSLKKSMICPPCTGSGQGCGKDFVGHYFVKGKETLDKRKYIRIYRF